ncbi:OmpH family outer membrane protein [Roseivivax marinus]|jgi:Skp family chaperone for outer membrane proteins|uniref:OmpH family outer membrane protein n=1 Tax=Roseivivax marinus TaxID=1379903 RepID=UPI0008D4115A|nr:OmpH family outer membrane protein [Roseivivax marinus]UMA66540.1 OmpH family outer membrane protein [Roseivivax marinus]SEK73505.1 chaperone for outer membrane proteins, Skp family [Roseivivax marinus]
MGIGRAVLGVCLGLGLAAGAAAQQQGQGGGSDPTGLMPMQGVGPLRSEGTSEDGGGPVRSPILTIERERVIDESAYGRRVLSEIEAEGNAIAAESERISEELREEELALTEARDRMEPAAFREAAQDFNEKVGRLRAQQDQKAQEFTARTEQARRAILAAAEPMMTDIMREAGAAVLLDRRQTIFSLDVTDVTDLVIERLDQRIGDGSDLDTAPLEADPDASAEPEDEGLDGAPDVSIFPETAPED